MKRVKRRFVVCVRNEDYAASIELRTLYRVVLDEAAAALHQLRVIDESGGGYLYPEEYFVPGKGRKERSNVDVAGYGVARYRLPSGIGDAIGRSPYREGNHARTR